MFTVVNYIRNLASSRCANTLTLFKKQFAEVHKVSRNVHISKHVCGKMFIEYENKYAYDILENKGYRVKLHGNNIDSSCEISQLLSEEQFNELVAKNWSSESPNNILKAFSMFGAYCSEHKQCISNSMFDNFIDCLTDSLALTTEKELESAFYALLKWPETESVRTRNFIEVWAALDEECLRRMKEWSYDTLLHFISLFYLINVTRASDFSTKALNKLATRAKNLSQGQLVQTLFFVGILRKHPFDMHNLELQLEKQFPELSIDDLAIMSMGFFKSKTPIRNMDIVLKMVDKVIENSCTINEVSLSALLKIIRYSTKYCIDNRIYRLLDCIQHEVSRVSITCTVHIALLGTSTLTLHKQCLNTIADKLNNSLSDARLKDLERLVLTYGTFNYIPNSDKTLIEKVLDELRKPEREPEIMKHGRSFSLCISYAGLLGFYPVDLISKVLNPEFLELTYGKHPYYFGREVLTLHNSAQIFCADATMNRLSDKIAKVLAKRYTDYIPTEEYTKQYNVAEKMFLDVFEVLKELRGSEFIVADHILTHHQRGDIIMCNNSEGSPLPVQAYDASSSTFGLIKKPPDSNKWIVMVVAGRNGIIQDSNTPTGHFQCKVRELKALGYFPALVTHSIYSRLSCKAEKTNYLNELINKALIE